MPAMPPVVLPPLELHDQDLVALALRHHLGCGQRLRLHRHLPLVVDEEDLGELDRRALVLPEALDLDDLARGHPVLLATRRDDRFHAATFLATTGTLRRPYSILPSGEPSRRLRDEPIAASAYLT